MIRRIIEIEEEKCNGCGACAAACHEGAIAMVDGKAKLMRDDYCDGLGDCLPTCPTGAISFVEREALAYDEAAVKENMKKAGKQVTGCPGTRAQALKGASVEQKEKALKEVQEQKLSSQLRQWPVQIRLVPIQAPYFEGADLLIAADCSAYAYANFHEDFMKNKVTLVGCPKLDPVDYSEKLAEIFRSNDIKSISVVRMQVPCCGGLEYAVKKAVQESGIFVPCKIVTLSLEGEILNIN